jgi:serine/threonine-protein kinase
MKHGKGQGHEPPGAVRSAPARLGAYGIGRRIGMGGMAEVYEASRQGPHGFHKTFAVKRILPDAARDPEFVAMFIQEAKLAACLSHPNIVQVFDFGEDDGELFLAMELVDGTTVSRVLRAVASRGEAVPLEVALHIASQAARALAHAHHATDHEGNRLGIVHRDVSPGNLLITRGGHVKLADFGIARAATQEHHTDAGHLRGKVGYMSPEQVIGAQLDSYSDVFTLTTILAEMVLGESLFSRGPELEVLTRIRDVDLRVLEQTTRHIPSDVRRLILLGLSARPDKRPSARGFANVVDEIVRRRGFSLHGPELVARMLSQYELVKHTGVPTDDPGARPTSLFPLDLGEQPSTTMPHPRPAVTDLGGVRNHSYQVKLETGREVGPVPFPELVRLTIGGVVGADALVMRNRDPYVRAEQLAELERFFATPALQWRKDEITKPKLRGELRAAILLPLIHSLAAGRETGMLYLDDGKQRKKVYFVDGRPDFVASTRRDELLGDYLVATGKCLPMELDMALAVLPQHGGRLGDALVALGVLRPVELYQAVAGQVRARYLEAFRWRDGHWLYVRGAQSREQTYPIEQNAHVLMRDAAIQLHPSELEAALSPLWEKVITVAPSAPAPLSAYQVPDTWSWVLAQATGSATVGHIFSTSHKSGVDPVDALRALFLGVSCQIVRPA